MIRRHLASSLPLLCLLSACSGNDSPTAPAPTPPAQIQSIALSADLASLKTKGQTAQVTATATMANGTTSNVTTTCTNWFADNASVLTISNAGLVTAQGSGTATVTTSCQGVSGRGLATVTLATPIVTLAGIVSDESTGSAIVGAVVNASPSGAGTIKSGTTDGNGYFSIAGLTGTVNLIAVANGYTGSSVTLTLVTDTRQDFRLRREAPAAPRVEYRITGDARRCSATYENSSGGTNQAEVNIPFSYSWNTARTGDFLYMSCQIDTGGDRGSINVEIYRNGALYRSAQAVGFPNIATASGTY